MQTDILTIGARRKRKPKQTATLIAVTLFAALSCTGCGTLVARGIHQTFPDGNKLPPYPGVMVDAVGVVTGPFNPPVLGITLVPLFAADLPFSAIVDTALLPSDLARLSRKP